MKFKNLFVLYFIVNLYYSYAFNNYCIMKYNNNNNNINNIEKVRRKILYYSLGFNIINPKLTNAYTSAYTQSRKIKNKNILNEIENEQKELFEEIIPSVCYISTEYTSMGEKFNINKEDLPKGVGSGFIWDDEGHIITNFHVINKVDNAIVTITDKNNNKKEYSAKLTGIDPDIDLAVLKIDAPKNDLKIINYNKSINTKVGQFAFAVGNPFGQDHTLTTGIISGTNRELSAPTGRKIYNVIQTDAAINPGNSGGPLLNSNGELIGINTASLGMGVSSGVGFTIPIQIALKSINEIIETGFVQKPILGISYMERNPSISESEKSGIPIIDKGILILDVPTNSTADKSGLRGLKINNITKKIDHIGDIIIQIDNDSINNPNDLNIVLQKHKPNDIITIKYLRDNKIETTKLKLDNYKGTTFTKLENEKINDADNTVRLIDIPLKNLEPEIKPKLSL
tara:strand:- start:536 stop:1900 length:1365 start_codon:yes stop_codon:yes gene_type:complete